MTAAADGIGLVVFDWAGTLSDHGSLAAVAAFREVFARHGVPVTAAQARAPMGLGKREHIEAMLRMPAVAEAWRTRRGDATRADIDALYTTFKEAQLAAIERHAAVIAGARETFAYLRARGIRIATTTGYFREANAAVLSAARAQGVYPEHAVCADDVSAGRPMPWMIYACMQALQICPPSRVLVVGDTVADIEAGKNGGCFSVGVTRTGNEVGLSEAEWAELEPQVQRARLARARAALRRAGADFVIESVYEVPRVIEMIERRAAGLAARRRSVLTHFERLAPSHAAAAHVNLGGPTP